MDAFDHRSIGNKLDLFHFQEEGPGMVFWHPKGWALYRLIEDYIRRRMKAAGFQEIKTPQILARAFWEKSGHWQKFGANMFALEDGERQFAVKPMSCPGHLQVFNARTRSYRDLPLRYAEFGAAMQRALRRVDGPDAHARLRPGRCPCALSHGSDCRGG